MHRVASRRAALFRRYRAITWRNNLSSPGRRANHLPRINEPKRASRHDNGVSAVEPGKCAFKNTFGRHGGRSHVLLHRDWNRIDQMDREAQVTLTITFISATNLTRASRFSSLINFKKEGNWKKYMLFLCV